MSFLYENELRSAIWQTQDTLKTNNSEIGNLKFVVENEQMFLKRKDLEPETIFVIVKMLAPDIEYNAKVQPVQVLILSEQNQLNLSKELFDKLAETYNFTTYGVDDDGIFVKYQYSAPVVLSNFNEVNYGYRSVMYMAITLSMMVSVLDVSDLTIDGVGNLVVKPIGFSIAYAMTGSTQQLATDYIATTVKSVSTNGISFSIPLLNNAVVNKILGIINGSIDGNTSFEVSYSIGDVEFEFDMKLISANIQTGINRVPSLMIGMQV